MWAIMGWELFINREGKCRTELKNIGVLFVADERIDSNHYVQKSMFPQIKWEAYKKFKFINKNRLWFLKNQ